MPLVTLLPNPTTDEEVADFLDAIDGREDVAAAVFQYPLYLLFIAAESRN